MDKECAFCPAVAKLSGEHLWSNWMGKLFPSKKFAFIQKDATGKVISQWDRHKIDMKAYVVCKPCNETWMSRLENEHAKPAMTDLILGNKDVILSKSQARSIALFAFKSAVIFDHMQLTKQEPFFLRSRRHRFAKCLAIPFGVHVWLSGFVPIGKGHVHTWYYDMTSNTGHNMELYVCTYAVGHLAFQVAAIKQNRLGAFAPKPGFNHLAIPLWPYPQGGIQWPPLYALMNISDFDAFSERWRSVKRVG